MLLAAGSIAQTPLITLTGGTNQGNVGNNIYFDLQVNQTITINQLVCLCGANTVAGTGGGLTVYLGPTTYVGNTDPAFSLLWTPVATVTGLTVAPSTMLTVPISPGLCLGAGNYGVALRSAAFNHGYTNGVTCTSNTIPGACSNSTFTRTELVLRAGANQNFPWGSGSQSPALNSPRIFNGEIHYTLGGTPIAVAAWEPTGKGCYKFYHSFRELYNNPSTSFDLESLTGTNTLPLINIGSGYAVGPFVVGTGTFYIPTIAATPLALTNDTTVTVATPFPVIYPTPSGPAASSSLIVCDNGFISPAGANGTAGAGSTAAFLAGQPRWAPAWCNHDPTTNGGQINFEVDPNGSQFYITWVGVYDFLNNGNAPGPNTFQIMFDNVGNVEYRYKAVSVAHGGTYPCLVGWTPGGAALDPGDVDISLLTTAFLTGPIDQHPLTLSMSARPLLGTSPIFSITNLEATQNVGGLMLNFADGPHTEMLAFGMPNCFQHVSNVNAITSLFIGNPGSVTFGIPNATAFNGVLVYGQALALGAVENAAFGLGINASNGVRCLLGNL
jgi:hypothetical protein